MAKKSKTSKLKPVDQIQFLAVLNSEFTYRHSVFWKIIYNTSYIIVALYSVPFLIAYPLTDELFLVAYPISGIIFAFAAYKILGMEYKLLMGTENRMNEIKRELDDKFSKEEYPIKPLKDVRLNERLAMQIKGSWLALMVLLGMAESMFILVSVGVLGC